MNRLLRSLTLSALICGLALPLAAAPKEGGKKKGDKKEAAPAAMYKLPDAVTLTDDQKPKVEALNKEYTPKFRALAKKSNDILTKEQRTARREAMKAAKEAGKKGKELRADVDAATMFSDDQKTRFTAVQEETTTLRKEMESKVVSLLTPEQKEQLPKPKKGKKRNKQAA